MILYEYECAKGHRFEEMQKFVDRDEQVPCRCGRLAARVMTTVRFRLDGTDAAFPTAYDRWARIHEQEAKREPV